MNVENRKLFVNRDARKRLSEMGGIMASSGELMNEVQKFAPGGEVVVEQYVAVIPGINGGRPVRLRGDTLARLQDLAPEIMQQAFVMDAATAAERGVDVNRLRPGDAFVERQLSSPTPSPVVQDSVEDKNFGQRVGDTLRSALQPIGETLRNVGQPIGEEIRAGLESSYNYNPLSGNFTAPDIPFRSLEDPTNPMVSLIESGLKSAGVEDPNAALIGQVDPSLVAQLSAPPMYDMTKFNRPTSATEPDMTALEALELQRASDPRSDEGIRARVAESAQRGMRAGEIANMLGRPLLEILDIGAGLASAGLLEGTAFASDVMSAFQSGVMGNTQAGEFYAGLATDIKDLSDEMYYNEGEVLPRLTAGLDKGSTEAELLEQSRKDIESQSLRNMSDAMLANDPSLFAEGSVSERLPDIPESVIQARKGTGPEVSFMGLAEEPGGAPLGRGSSETINFTALPEEDVLRSNPSNLPYLDTSTGVPLTVDEIAERQLTERIEAADAGLTNIQEQPDRFPAEDAYQEAQQAEINRILYPERARKFRAEEERLAGRTEGMTDAEAKAFNEKVRAELESEKAEDGAQEQVATTKDGNGLDESLRPRARPDLPSIEKIAKDPKLSPEQKASAASDQLFSDITGQKISMSAKDSVKAYEKMFSEMLGMDDKDAEKEMWHNMAMIGFAIAAGESPSALQNIANGMLAGTKMMKEDRATKQKREDAVKTMAIERAFKLEDDAAKFQRDLALARVRGSGTDKYTTERERSRLKEVILRDPYAYPGLLGDDGQIDPNRLNTYLDSVVTGDIPEKPKLSQEEAIAQYNSILATRPELKSVMLTRLRNEGYDTKGL